MSDLDKLREWLEMVKKKNAARTGSGSTAVPLGGSNPSSPLRRRRAQIDGSIVAPNGLSVVRPRKKRRG